MIGREQQEKAAQDSIRNGILSRLNQNQIQIDIKAVPWNSDLEVYRIERDGGKEKKIAEMILHNEKSQMFGVTTE